MDAIKSSFLEHHQNKGYATHESFPLVIEDPTVLFTNATITPFKPMFSGDIAFSDFALAQRCLRLGGTGGTVNTARTDMNYTSLFNMLGSGTFNISHGEAIDYFVETLDALGLERKKLILSSIAGQALESALSASALDSNQVRILENPATIQHDWSFGEGDLHGQGVIAWYAEQGNDQNPDLSDCLQIGRIVDIDGISRGSSVEPFEHTAFDVGLGAGRVELALTGKNDVSMMQWRVLSEQFKDAFNGINDGDAHYMANLCQVIDELTAEGLIPGNKRHAYVLRKITRLLIEEIWVQSKGLVSVQDMFHSFVEGAIPQDGALAAILGEEEALRRVLAEAELKRSKNPTMTPEELHATFGIKPSLFSLS